MGIEGQDNFHAIRANRRQSGIAALNFLGIDGDSIAPLEKTISVLVFEICLTSAIRTIGPFLRAGLTKCQEIGQSVYSHDLWTEFSWAHSPSQKAIDDPPAKRGGTGMGKLS
jgi:hypothetical protein